jgi:hypothetical protein
LFDGDRPVRTFDALNLNYWEHKPKEAKKEE